jgi:serine/threonine-protein kinase HipA
MSKDGRWSVSPAYDICFTYDLTGMGFSNHHELSLNGKTREFERNDLIVFGQQNDISQPEKILDHVCSVLSDFRKYAKENGISETVSDIIQKHLDHNMGIDREQLETTTVSQLPEGIVLSRISITSNKKGRALTIEVNNRHRMSKSISSEDYIAQRVGLLSKEKLALKYFKEEIGAISKEL